MPTGSYETTLDDRNFTVDSRGWIDAMVTGSFKGAALSGRAFGDYSGYDGTYLYLDGTHSIDTADGAWVGIEGTASRRAGDRHQMTTGLDYRRNVRQDQDSHYVAPFVSNVDSHYRSNQGAVYAQDEIQLHRRVTATVGGRYDWWSLTGGTVTPRVGLVYRTDADTAIKALFGGAYRAPTVYETYYYPDPSGACSGRSGCARPRWSTSSTSAARSVHRDGYISQAKNLISRGAESCFKNRDESRSRGVEVEAEHRWTSGRPAARQLFVAQHTDNPTIAGVELSTSPSISALVQAERRHGTAGFRSRQDVGNSGHRLSIQGTHITRSVADQRPTSRSRRRAVQSRSPRASRTCSTPPYAQPVGFEFRQDMMSQDGRSVSVRAMLRF